MTLEALLLTWAEGAHLRLLAEHASALRWYETIAAARLDVGQALEAQDLRGEELSPALLALETRFNAALGAARARLLVAWRRIEPS